MTDRTARRWALAATSLGFGVVQLDVSVVNVAVQPIRADLHTGVSGAQWVVSAYTVAFAAFIPGAGALGDRIGAKRVFVAGFALFTVASIGCGLAPGLGALIAFRTAQGVGAAVLVPCSLTLLNHAYPEAAERTRAVGLWAAGASVGLSGGPLVGGVLTATLSWRWIFLINLPLGLLGLALGLIVPAMTSALLGSTGKERSGVASGTLNTARQTGSVLGVAVFGSLAASDVAGGLRASVAVSIGLALATVALARGIDVT